jgi:hypothetical protein
MSEWVFRAERWTCAVMVVAWATYQAFRPSALGLPQWLHTVIILALSLRIAWFAWFGALQAAPSGETPK